MHGLAAGGDGVLLHRLQERGLGFGWGAVDLVGEDDMGEERALNKAEGLATVGVFFEDVGAGDIGGHEIGGELDATEGEVEGAGQGLDQRGLGQARDADQ